MVRFPPKRHVAASFSRKAHLYDDYARIQHRMAEALADCLQAHKAVPPGPWLDLGCGTGYLARIVEHRFRSSPIGVDLAARCLRVARRRAPGLCFVNADIEALPFIPASAGVVLTSSVLQWIPAPLPLLDSIHNILTEKGLLAFAVFLEGTLEELFGLRQRHGFAPPVFFPTEDLLHDQLRRAGFEPNESICSQHRAWYADGMGLVKALVNTGTAAIAGQRLPPRRLREFCAEYESLYAAGTGVYATYRWMVGVAVRSDAPRPAGPAVSPQRRVR